MHHRESKLHSASNAWSNWLFNGTGLNRKWHSLTNRLTDLWVIQSQEFFSFIWQIKLSHGCSCHGSVVTNWTGNHENASLIPGLAQWLKDPAWLWRRPAATAPIRPLAWELPYAVGAALKKQNKTNNCNAVQLYMMMWYTYIISIILEGIDFIMSLLPSFPVPPQVKT